MTRTVAILSLVASAFLSAGWCALRWSDPVCPDLDGICRTERMREPTTADHASAVLFAFGRWFMAFGVVAASVEQRRRPQ